MVATGDGWRPNFRPAGLRSVPVNGRCTASTARRASCSWYNEVENQHLILTQFEELPMLFFTARYQKWIGQLPDPQP